MNTNIGKKSKHPRPSSQFTFFSTKNTENNSTCSQSILIQPTNNAKHQIHQPSVPQKKHEQIKIKDIQGRYSVKTKNITSTKDKSQQRYLVAQRSYQAIERVLQDQNLNLKLQNRLLLAEVSRLKEQKKKYKLVQRKQKIQIEALRQQCNAHKIRADQYKDVTMNRLLVLQEKLIFSASPRFNTSLPDVVDFRQELQQ